MITDLDLSSGSLFDGWEPQLIPSLSLSFLICNVGKISPTSRTDVKIQFGSPRKAQPGGGCTFTRPLPPVTGAVTERCTNTTGGGELWCFCFVFFQDSL